jgi:hypothetical protein
MSGLDFKDVKDRQLAMDIALKCGDINNASKPQDISTRWSQLIMEEFFQQVFPFSGKHNDVFHITKSNRETRRGV